MMTDSGVLYRDGPADFALKVFDEPLVVVELRQTVLPDLQLQPIQVLVLAAHLFKQLVRQLRKLVSGGIDDVDVSLLVDLNLEDGEDVPDVRGYPFRDHQLFARGTEAELLQAVVDAPADGLRVAAP